MPEIPKNALTRGVRIATLPASYAGRTAWGFGKKVGGKPADAVTAEIQQRTAEQIFAVLGQLKGGAMKLGQAMSIFEAALPEEMAGPYRATLTKLQDAAPAMPAETVHEILAESLGPDWRDRFADFDDTPAGAASIGQVHKALWHDGREVAVKVQYPGADKALIADLNQMARMGKMFSSLVPGLDLKSLVAELKERVIEELDYLGESRYQRQFAVAFDGDPEFRVPHVLAAAPHVLITEWVDGRPMSDIIANGTSEERDRIGLLYERFLLSGPARAGLLHADPHPGNFRMTPDGRLCVFDFGAVSVLPDGLPPAMGTLLRIAQSGDADSVVQGLRDEGFVLPHVDIDPEQLLNYLDPFVEPARHEFFHFNRAWLRGQFTRINDVRGPDFAIGLKINLPPSYALIHRVWLGSIGVLCQLDATVPVRGEIERWVPDFTEPTPAGS
ncbi:MAG: AarF/ABC1/UbiB kinase family protein [Candidatus Nanopelagicales bacterium]|nr:AarF/ABC1/UbiB kinase family protein [Candidatus Nanopelagicales bacterium]